jgi:hypothetical protein
MIPCSNWFDLEMIVTILSISDMVLTSEMLLLLSNCHVSSGSGVPMCCSLGQAIEVEHCGVHSRIVQICPMRVPVFGSSACCTSFRMPYFVDK